MALRRIARVSFFAIALAAGGTARAQTADEKAQAEVLFEQGKKLMSEQRYSEACTKLSESNKLDSGVGTLLFLGECYRLDGRNASAWATFREAESIANRTADPRGKIAQGRAQELEPKLSKLVVEVASPAEGLAITRDGAAVSASLYGVEVPVDPGRHVLRAVAPKHEAWETTVDVGKDGARASVTVPKLARLPEPKAPPTALPAPPPAGRESAGGTQRAIGLGVAGLGVVGLGVGTYLGLRASSQLSDAEPHCGSAGCDQTGFDLKTDARSNANMATAAFVAGGALVVGGAVLYFVAPRKRAGLGVGAPGSALGASATVRF